MKKVLRWLFYILIGLLLAGAMIPFVFEKQIKENIKIALNENLNAKVNFTDVSLSLFRDFPQISVGISDLSIYGVGKFEGQSLFKAENTYLSLPLSTLFTKDNNEITEITLDKPELNVIVLNKTEANYDIVKPSSDTTNQISYSIALKNYTINDGTIFYKDFSSNQDIELKGLDHQGSGNFKDVDFDLITTTTVKDFNIVMDDIPYLKNATAKMDALIHLNTDDLSFKYENANILLNSLAANSSGYIKMNDNEDIDLDINMATKGQSFKNILSVIPYFFTKDFEKVKSDGSASINGKIKGIYNGTKNQMPAFDFDINIENGFIQYPTMPLELKDVFTKMIIKSTQAQMQDLSVDVSAFKMKLGNDPIDGRLKLNLNDVKGDFNGKIDLNNWRQFLPIEGMGKLTGIIAANIKLDSKIADIQNNNYDNINLVGSGTITDLNLELKDMLPLTIKKGSFNAEPKLINLQSDEIKYGKSDFATSALIENPLLIFIPEKESKIKLISKSNLIDLDEITSIASSETNSVSSSPDLQSLEKNNTNLDLEFSADKIVFNSLNISNIKAKGNFGNDVLNIDNLSANIDQSDLQMDGKIINAKGYLFKNDTLSGDINLKSKRLDLNPFMTENQKSANDAATETISVPDRTSINIKANIEEVLYTNMVLKDIEGNVVIKDQKGSLKNVVGNSLGGRIAMDGSYDTKNVSNPKVDIKLLFDNLKFREAFDKIEIFRKISPIAKYITGNFNSTFTFNSALDNKMSPKLSSISSSGFFETLNGFIDNFIPFEKIGEKLGTQSLKSIPLENTKNWFEVVDGKVIVHPFTKNWNDINMDIKGSHFLEGDMDYEIIMQIPRQLLKSNNITGAVVGGLTFLEKEASKYGVNLNQGEFIDLKINLTGKLNSPIIKIKPLGSSGQSVKSQIETGIKNKIDETKKDVKDKVNKEVDKVRDSVKTVIKTEVDKVKTQAEEKKNEVIDTVKAKAVSKVKDAVDKTLPDSLGGKSKEEIKDKAEKEIDKIKDKLGGWNPLKKKGG